MHPFKTRFRLATILATLMVAVGVIAGPALAHEQRFEPSVPVDRPVDQESFDNDDLLGGDFLGDLDLGLSDDDDSDGNDRSDEQDLLGLGILGDDDTDRDDDRFRDDDGLLGGLDLGGDDDHDTDRDDDETHIDVGLSIGL